MLLALASLYETTAAQPPGPQPYVLLSDVVVEGMVIKARSLVELVHGSPLYLAYGGDANLEPLPADQQGDAQDADHSAIGD